MLRKHLVIVGSGWAGLKLARQLKNVEPHKLRITLISDINYFRYSAALYRVATGHREKEAIIPLSEILEDLPNVDFVKATVKKIDRQHKTITASNGRVFHYDYAVLALGAVTTYFNIPGLDKWSYSIKTSSELKKFRTHLHQELVAEHAPDKNYVVIGAGPTGVELSAALASYMKLVVSKHGIKHRRISVNLIEASPRVLPTSKPNISEKVEKRLKKLGVRVLVDKKVESEDGNYIYVSGKAIPSKTVIWTAGVSNNQFFQKNASQFVLSKRGKVIVDDHLRVDDSLYVIGDNAETPYSGLGLTAVHNGHYVAKDIKRRLAGKQQTPAYKPLVPAVVIPTGRRWAVFSYRSLSFGGIPGSIMRSLADLTAYHDITGLRKAIVFWLRSDDKEEKCTICRMQLDTNNQI